MVIRATSTCGIEETIAVIYGPLQWTSTRVNFIEIYMIWNWNIYTWILFVDINVMASCLHRNCRLYHTNSNFPFVSNRGHDRMVVGFTTTDAISAYFHWCCEFESRSGRGEQHYVIKCVSDLRQGGGFLRVLYQ